MRARDGLGGGWEFYRGSQENIICHKIGNEKNGGSEFDWDGRKKVAEREKKEREINNKKTFEKDMEKHYFLFT